MFKNWNDRGARPSRNPRYAPEFLEKRLKPSSFGVAAVAAEVTYLREDEPKYPEPLDLPYEDPIPLPPYFPTGPSGPG
jgi:hypothetical protein